jgi:hypothetical protein
MSLLESNFILKSCGWVLRVLNKWLVKVGFLLVISIKPLIDGNLKLETLESSSMGGVLILNQLIIG